jgi:hypothetical protein
MDGTLTVLILAGIRIALPVLLLFGLGSWVGGSRRASKVS